MGPLLSLFGGDNAVLTVLIALAVVLVLIILGVWALKLVFNATGRASRGRAKRLGVIDVTPVDQKRQLVLVRRDNVEHLLLIGGSQDVVVESGIIAQPMMPRMPRPSQPSPKPPGQRPAAQQPQPGKQPSGPHTPAAPPPSAPAASTPAVTSPGPSSPARVRGTNLPPDLVATRSGTPSTRGSLRHSALLRPNERQEPEFIPSPPPEPISGPADSDTQVDVEPIPHDAGTGSDQPDFGSEPQVEPNGDEDRPGEANRDQ